MRVPAELKECTPASGVEDVRQLTARTGGLAGGFPSAPVCQGFEREEG
jgi:hypothetical protein